MVRTIIIHSTQANKCARIRCLFYDSVTIWNTMDWLRPINALQFTSPGTRILYIWISPIDSAVCTKWKGSSCNGTLRYALYAMCTVLSAVLPFVCVYVYDGLRVDSRMIDDSRRSHSNWMRFIEWIVSRRGIFSRIILFHSRRLAFVLLLFLVYCSLFVWVGGNSVARVHAHHAFTHSTIRENSRITIYWSLDKHAY